MNAEIGCSCGFDELGWSGAGGGRALEEALRGEATPEPGEEADVPAGDMICIGGARALLETARAS